MALCSQAPWINAPMGAKIVDDRWLRCRLHIGQASKNTEKKKKKWWKAAANGGDAEWEWVLVFLSCILTYLIALSIENCSAYINFLVQVKVRPCVQLSNVGRLEMLKKQKINPGKSNLDAKALWTPYGAIPLYSHGSTPFHNQHHILPLQSPHQFKPSLSYHLLRPAIFALP